MTNILELAHLADDVYLDRSMGLGGWHRDVHRPAHAGMSGFFGAAYRKGTTLAIAFRGSESSDIRRDWIVNDGAIATKVLPLPQLPEAMDYAAAVIKLYGTRHPVYIIGHSLGGALTQVVAGSFAHTTGITFNAPGMADHRFPGRHGFVNAAHVVNIRAARDPVSCFGAFIGKPPISVPHAHGAKKTHAHHAIGGGIFAGAVNWVADGVQSGVDKVEAVADVARETAGAHSMKNLIADIAADQIHTKTPEQLSGR